MFHGPLLEKARLLKSEKYWLFLDYDGTLAEFAPTPDIIQIDTNLLMIIDRLLNLPGLKIAIVSGRRLSHIQKLIPIQGVLLAGTYGIEIQSFDGKTINRLDFEEVRKTLTPIKEKFEEITNMQNGFYLEDKGWSIAIHARFADNVESKKIITLARQFCEDKINKSTFQLLGGHKFFEVAPKLANKGSTIRYLLQKYPFPNALPIFVGDDDKDEEAFKVINELRGISILVSQNPQKSAASLRIGSPHSVRNWLSEFGK